MIRHLTGMVLALAACAMGVTSATAQGAREDYPAEALKRREQGDVKLSMCVGVDGRARDAKVVQSSGSDALDKASVAAMKKVRFTPGKDSSGNPVDMCDHVLTIAWRLPPG